MIGPPHQQTDILLQTVSMNTDPHILLDSGPELMTKVPHEIGELVILHQILQFEPVMHQDPQIVMKNEGGHARGRRYPETGLQAPQEVPLAAGDDRVQVPTLVHEVQPLESLYYHRQSPRNSAGGHTFSLATEFSPSEIFRLEILDCVSRNFILQ